MRSKLELETGLATGRGGGDYGLNDEVLFSHILKGDILMCLQVAISSAFEFRFEGLSTFMM